MRYDKNLCSWRFKIIFKNIGKAMLKHVPVCYALLYKLILVTCHFIRVLIGLKS